MQFFWALVAGLFGVVSLYRLPGGVTPSHYKLQILSYLGEPNNFAFDGKVWIQVTCHRPANNITLNSKSLNITDNRITVNDISTSLPKDVKVTNVQLDSENEFLIINFPKQLEQGHKYKIFIPFRGVMEEDLEGFYRSSYVDERTNRTVWLGVTHFEAIGARKAFPCFDEPAMKAVFEITLGRHKDYSSLSNMPLLITEPIQGKPRWYWDKFEPTPPMSTYLVAFVVSNFDHSSSRFSPTRPFQVWSRRSVQYQVNFASEIGPKSLDYYANFFNVTYPLSKMDLVAVPDFISGMENWGLNIFRESYILFDPDITSLSEKNRLASAIVHELSHQWVGNLVSINWWTDLWLKEGFATYMASRAVGHIFPRWKSEDEDVVNSVSSVFSFDVLSSSHPALPEPTGQPDEIIGVFDTISYDKGSLLVRMMVLFFGEDMVRKGLNNHLKKYAYKNADQDQLWESFEEVRTTVLPRHLTIKKVMDSWTLQTGYPLLTVTRDYTKNKITIKQQRYFTDLNKGEDESCWWVPLTYTNGYQRNFNSTRPKYWLSCPKRTLVIDCEVDANTWILFNVKLGALYRVNYDDKNWDLISTFLNSENHVIIPALDKMQLIANAFDLASTDRLKFDIWFNLVEYLQHENEYLPWKAALDNYQYLYVQLEKTSLFETFKTYLRQCVFSMFQKLGGVHIFDGNSDNLPSIKLREIIANWACKLGLPECTSKAQEFFQEYQKNPNDKKIIPKNFRTVIYSTAIRNGGEKEWDLLWEQYKKSNVPSEKSEILESLACTKNSSLLRHYLELTLQEGSGIKKLESGNVFSAIIDQEHGYHVARNFLYKKVKDIVNYLSTATDFLTNLRRVTTTEAELQELQDFLNQNIEYFPVGDRDVQQTLEIAKVNVQWRRHLKDVGMLLVKANQ